MKNNEVWTITCIDKYMYNVYVTVITAQYVNIPNTKIGKEDINNKLMSSKQRFSFMRSHKRRRKSKII